MKIDLEMWKNPSKDYRPVPFWSLNDKLTVKELRRQIRDMKKHGFGGVFMHARSGLVTSYLSKEWFKLIADCVDEAKKVGINAWIYDEDRWPSGFAGGAIADDPKLDHPLYALSCRKEKGKLKFDIVRARPSKWLNQACEPNILDPEVTKAFMESTYNPYAKLLKKEFAKTVPGVFTDEPSYTLFGNPDNLKLLPWIKDMEKLFKEKNGYELRPHLASLFANQGEDFRRVRVDFFRTITKVFVQNYCQQLHRWCKKNTLELTGHMMHEDSFHSQLRATGAVMPHYEYFTFPGIDHLGCKPAGPLLQKQCVSVARQLGKNRVLSECLGGAGWKARLGELKKAADEDLAYGINFFNQHLAYYSIRGCRKRDYPTTCSYHLPGYSLYKSFNDYYSRLSYLLSQGKAVSKILLLHPIQSAWALYTPERPGEVNKLNNQFVNLSKTLLSLQREHDYGDELLLEKYGKVEKVNFIVGKEKYQAVVVPPAETWSSNTFKLLKSFASNGGKIVVVEKTASYVDGKKSPELVRFQKSSAVTRIKANLKGLDKALESIPRDIVVKRNNRPVKDLVYHHRLIDNLEIFFLHFGTNEKAFTAKVSLPGTGQVELWDAQTGTKKVIPSIFKADQTEFNLTIPKQGSCLVSIDRKKSPSKIKLPIAKKEIPLEGPWKVSRLDPNVLLLDRGRLKFGDSPWTHPMTIQGGGGTTSLPNAHDLILSSINNGDIFFDIGLRFDIQTNFKNPQKVKAGIVIEDSRVMTGITINGEKVKPTNNWWLDRHFKVHNLDGKLKKGKNCLDCIAKPVSPTVDSTMIFTPEGAELENSYLIGDFHVDWDGKESFKLVDNRPLPTDPSCDLTRKGLPFYTGTIRYEKQFRLGNPPDKVVLTLPTPHGDGVRVRINGKPVRDLWGEPFEVECKNLKRGMNTIQIDLFTNPGNILGLIHHKAPWSDPGHFYSEYFLEPTGLGGVPSLIIMN